MFIAVELARKWLIAEANGPVSLCTAAPKRPALEMGYGNDEASDTIF